MRSKTGRLRKDLKKVERRIYKLQNQIVNRQKAIEMFTKAGERLEAAIKERENA